MVAASSGMPVAMLRQSSVPGCRALLRRVLVVALEELDSSQRNFIILCYGLGDESLGKEWTPQEVRS